MYPPHPPTTAPAPPLPLTARRRKKTNLLPLVLAGGLMAFMAMVALFVIGFVLLLVMSVERVPDGVQVAGIPFGGERIDEAESLLRANLTNQTVTLRDLDRTWTVDFASLGVAIDYVATVSKLESAVAYSNVIPVYTIDLVQAQNKLAALSFEVTIPAAPGLPGRTIEIPVLLDRLRVDLNGELADGMIDLPMMAIEPVVVEAEPEPIEQQPVYVGPTTTHIVEAGQELALIARQYQVDMDDIVQMNDIENPDLLYVGQALVIPAAGVYQPTSAEAPPAPSQTGKSILVSTSKQRIYAYENGELVRSHIVSTGRDETPTVLGDYKVYVKYAADDMSGPDYFLPAVPWTMYFYQGYAIHGTYWHNSFGRQMSHGCVNLPVNEAQWWFDWAEVGTPVRVIQ